MNRKPSGSSILLSRAIDGFLNFKAAEGITARTLDSYKRHLEKWLEHEGDQEVRKVSSQAVIRYLNWLRTEYVPRRTNGQKHALSGKTLRNVWITLSALYTWANREMSLPNIMKDVPAPKFKDAPVIPFTKEEVEALLKACSYTREVDPVNRRKFAMKRPTASRDEAIILTLLDTGLRAMELCRLRIGDLDLKTGKAEVRHGVVGGAKGGKGRTVYLGKVTRKAVWRYLNSREDADDLDAPVFLGLRDRPLTPNALRHLIVGLAKRAGVHGAHPHKFRHTMAITYLRSEGDIFTLQSLLGHSSLDMVRHYSNLAQVDVQNAHKKASPVDNWRL